MVEKTPGKAKVDGALDQPKEMEDKDLSAELGADTPVSYQAPISKPRRPGLFGVAKGSRVQTYGM